MSKAVYATVTVGGESYRLGAQQSGDKVAVWIVSGGQLGFYNLSRFENQKVTVKTIQTLFNN